MKVNCLLLIVLLNAIKSSPTQAACSNSNSLFKDTTSPMILPVHCLDFTAIQKEKSVFLKWSTLHEDGIKRFTIERSDDGNDFHEIGSTMANGNSSKLQEYQFEDLQPQPG